MWLHEPRLRPPPDRAHQLAIFDREREVGEFVVARGGEAVIERGLDVQ
ncbi:hypothetical protein [Polyangium mundeleinium]|uniref:Uncharacterized protein n=1 Tax=Polyangium mundeleinium TaxID=2995306 RepID=A0ABT5EXA7_9BACT|nr:hypothetical protein [Polyangium mundeleinium]MDC0746431.1 hypothetical protein [Polyangium mundeleinium]